MQTRFLDFQIVFVLILFPVVGGVGAESSSISVREKVSLGGSIPRKVYFDLRRNKRMVLCYWTSWSFAAVNLETLKDMTFKRTLASGEMWWNRHCPSFVFLGLWCCRGLGRNFWNFPPSYFTSKSWQGRGFTLRHVPFFFFVLPLPSNVPGKTWHCPFFVLYCVWSYRGLRRKCWNVWI